MEIIAKKPIQFDSSKDQKGVVSTLKKVKKFLTKKRWVQGIYDTEDGKYCLIGAVNKIDGPYEYLVKELMYDEARHRGASWTEGYNDVKGRTYKHIEGFLNTCITRAEKGQIIKTKD